MIRNIHICHWCWEPITIGTRLDEDDISPLSEFEGETFHTLCLDTMFREEYNESDRSGSKEYVNT